MATVTIARVRARALRPTGTAIATLAAMAGWIALAWPHVAPEDDRQAMSLPSDSAAPDSSASSSERHASIAEYRIGGYGGASYTHPSVVTIRNGAGTDMTVSGFDWIGRPFKAPIYYGARIQRLPTGAGLGTMLDFTHDKAIARDESVARFTGTRNGQPVAPSARIEDVFRHLEFSHGHNMLTLNGLWRMPRLGAGFRPYAGAGAGVSLPHTEVAFKGDNVRTYEYQFAGFVGQALAGIEIPLGRVSLFLEYKFTYAPYRVPLSHEPYGWLLVTDVWRQFRAWAAGEAPPGGWLDTTLAGHHGIGGMMIRVSR
jgi:hypothetical protein